MKKEIILLLSIAIMVSVSIIAFAGDYETDKIPLTSTTTTTSTTRYETDKTTTAHTDINSTTKRSPDKMHIEGEAVRENIIEPSCTDTGSYDLVIYCELCGEEISREAKAIEPLGHVFVLRSFKDNVATITCKRTGCEKTKSVCFDDYYNKAVDEQSVFLNSVNDKFINAKDFAKLLKEQK